MIVLHGSEETEEFFEAEKIRKSLIAQFPILETDRKKNVDIFSSVQCYGQDPQDIDIVITYFDNSSEGFIKTFNGEEIKSFCVTIEVKGHSAQFVEFQGNECYVKYKNKSLHSVSYQSERQKYSLKEYLQKHNTKPPWIGNLIFLTRVSQEQVPDMATNIIGSEFHWNNFSTILEQIHNKSKGELINCYGNINIVNKLLSNKLVPTALERKRLEYITKSILDSNKQKYVGKIGKQLLLFQGLGGTGKTVRLLQIGLQLYREKGLRVLVLTYNHALRSDLARLFAIHGVKNIVGSEGMIITTVESFMHKWLYRLGLVDEEYFEASNNRKEKYLQLLDDAVELMKSEDISSTKSNYSADFDWDLILIDEAQDWPIQERNFISAVYGPNQLIVAHGVNQMVRGQLPTDWRALARNNSQVVSLRKALRLKSSLCDAVGLVAKELDLLQWDLEPQKELTGGKIKLMTTKDLTDDFFKNFDKELRQTNNCPIDVLFCVPSYTNDPNKIKSDMAIELLRKGFKVWDGVKEDSRQTVPESTDQYRLVTYESCRGLEGWQVMCMYIDEFFDYKLKNAPAPEGELLLDPDEFALEYAKNWLMIPLTRAIDTLYLHIKDRNSTIGVLFDDLSKRYPSMIEWID
ncbi:MAG: hypothetical protein P8I94_04460 [Emcibacteraceae bacterium]|nr:hypothetical protein [Emcibacteraceae bacterium]